MFIAELVHVALFGFFNIYEHDKIYAQLRALKRLCSLEAYVPCAKTVLCLGFNS